MGILQKLKRLTSLHTIADNTTPHPPNGRPFIHDRNPPPNFEYGPLPDSFLNAANAAREASGYDPLPVFDHEATVRNQQNLRREKSLENFAGFNRARSKSRERIFDPSVRRGSPQHFHHPLPGTPVKYRRRPVSPELLQPRNSSPFLIRQKSLPGSPEMRSHFQHVQHLQHLQNIARQQEQQQRQMMMGYPAQYYPQFQQPSYPMMNPRVNMPPWLMMQQQQPQQPMYPFY